MTREEAVSLGLTKQKTGDYTSFKPTSGAYVPRTEGEAINGLLANKGVASTPYINAMTALTKETENEARMFRTTYTDYFGVITKMTDASGKALISQENADKILAQINAEYKAELLAMEKNGILISDENNPLAQIAQKIIRLNAILSADEAVFTKVFNDFNLASSKTGRLGPGASGGGTLIRLQAEQFGNSSLMLGGKEGAMLLHSINEEMLQFKDQFIKNLRATAQEAGLVFNETLIPEIDKAFISISENMVKEGKLSGTFYVASLQEQIDKTLGISLEESAIKSAEASAIAFEEAGALDGTSWLLGFKSKMGVGTGKPSSMGAMGIAMGGTMLGMSMSGSKNQAVSTAGSAITMGANAAMIASFLPIAPELIIPIALAVGALTVAYKALSKVMADQKAHNDAIAASFESASGVISAYGGKMIVAKQAVYNFIDANKQSKEVLNKTAQDVAEIKKLGASDPLKQVGELLKGGTTASGIIGTLNQFAAAQVANGMDPKSVSQMVTDLLTYSGQTKYLNQALKEITNSTKDMSTATATMINKLKNNGDANLVTATTYKDMSKAQKAFADGLLTTTNIISDQATPFQVAADKIKALRDTSDGSIGSLNALTLALKNAGASAETLSAMANLAKIGVTNLGEISTILMLNAAGIQVNTTDPTQTTEDVKNGIVKYVQEKQKSLIESDKAALKIEQDKVAAAKKAAETAAKTATTKQLKNEQAALGVEGAIQYRTDQEELKVLEAQLATLKLQTSELQKQQQYQLSQADIDSQIRLAAAQGDYLKVSLLTQQKAYNTSQYNQNNSQDKLQQQVDNLKQTLADRGLLIQNKIDSTSSTTADMSGVILAIQKLKDDQLTGKQLAAQMTILLADSGLGGFKAMFDGKGNYTITTTGNVNVNGTSEKPLGSASNPFKDGNAAQAAKSISLSNSMDPKYWDNIGLKAGILFGGPGYDVRQEVKKYAATKGYKMGTVFELDTDTNQYVFLVKDKDGNIQMESNTPIKKATGGHISGPGTGTSDSIPAYLSNGEYVVKADAVSHYGPSFFDSVNAKKFANGGSVKNESPLSEEWRGMKSSFDFLGVTSLINILRGKGKKSDTLAIASLFPAGKFLKGATEIEKVGASAYKAKFAIQDAEEAAKAAKLAQISRQPEFASIEQFIQRPMTAYNSFAENFNKNATTFFERNNLRVPAGHETYRGLSPADLFQLKNLKVGDVWNPGVVKSTTTAADKASFAASRASNTGGGWTDSVAKIEVINPKGIPGIHSLEAIGRPTGISGEGLMGPNTKYKIASIFPKNSEFENAASYILHAFANGGLVNIPSFSVGTNFVPNDMIAQIHKGERIIPASQNNGTMDGSTYNISVTVNNEDANGIANVIMDKIKRTQGMTSSNRAVKI
jgi:hypothetical protein